MDVECEWRSPVTEAFVKVLSQMLRLLLGIGYVQQTKEVILRNDWGLGPASFALESALLQKPYIGYACLIMR